MKTLSHYLSHPQISALGPVALLTAAVATKFILSRAQRSSIASPRPRRRRLSAPSGAIKWLVIAAAALGLLLAFGIDLQGLWSTLLGVLSLVAIGFVAMWSILSHMLASVLIVIFRPFEAGDRIEVVGDDPVLGEVVDLNLVYTTLRTEDGGTLQIPNNLFFQKVLKRHAPTGLASPQLGAATPEAPRGHAPHADNR